MRRETRLNRVAGPAPRTYAGGWEQHLDWIVLALGRSPWGSAGYGRPRGILHIFRFVERLIERRRPLRPLRAGGIVRYEIASLPARPIPLDGRAPVPRGEPVVILHFDNRVLASLAESATSIQALTWRLVRLGSGDLRLLADMARSGALPKGVRAVWAETVFYQALPRVGFTLRPAPRTIRTPFARLFMLCMLAMYGRPGQLARSRSLNHLQLGEAWMSLDELRRRFPSRRSGAAAAALADD
jgi:hypothetical protein